MAANFSGHPRPHRAAQTVQAGAFGERMGRYFHLLDAPSLSTSSFQSGQLAVTRLYSDSARPSMSELIPAEKSFICELHLAPAPHRETWRGARLVQRGGYAKDAIEILDLRDAVQVYVGSPLDSLSFHLPQSMLDEFADDAGMTLTGELRCEPGVVDPVMAHLGAALMPALQRPGQASALFFDHLALAINAHLLQRYGGLRALSRMPAGTLTPAKERRAKDMLMSRLSGDISIAEVASACGLSRSHFIRAFRHSTGVTPLQWLQRYKVDKARELLRTTTNPIVDVAAACGFADQSHLTRTFTRCLGLAPAAWRRQLADTA